MGSIDKTKGLYQVKLTVPAIAPALTDPGPGLVAAALLLPFLPLAV